MKIACGADNCDVFIWFYGNMFLPITEKLIFLLFPPIRLSAFIHPLIFTPLFP